MAMVDVVTCCLQVDRSLSAWSKDRQPSGAVLHSSHKPGELSQ